MTDIPDRFRESDGNIFFLLMILPILLVPYLVTLLQVYVNRLLAIIVTALASIKQEQTIERRFY